MILLSVIFRLQWYQIQSSLKSINHLFNILSVELWIFSHYLEIMISLFCLPCIAKARPTWLPYITVYKPHFFAAEKISKSGVRFIHGTPKKPKKQKKQTKIFFFKVSIYAPPPGAMPGNVSQLGNRCVDSPLGN